MVVTTILACACVGGQAYESQISISTYIIYFDKITTLFFVMQGLKSRPQSDDLPLERTMTIAWIYTQIPYTTLAAILCIVDSNLEHLEPRASFIATMELCDRKSTAATGQSEAYGFSEDCSRLDEWKAIE